MSEPDWNVAPPETSHWAPEDDNYHQCWYRKFDGFWEFMRIGSDMENWKKCPEQPDRARRDMMVARHGAD